MKIKTHILQTWALAVALAAAPALAQEHEHHPGGPPPPGTAPAPGCCANMGAPQAGGPPAAGMAGMDMGSCPHMQAGKLADELLASFAALEQEADMAALKLKLAAHGALLKQLKTTTGQKCPMMEHMGGMGGMGGMQHNMPAR